MAGSDPFGTLGVSRSGEEFAIVPKPYRLAQGGSPLPEMVAPHAFRPLKANHPSLPQRERDLCCITGETIAPTSESDL